MRTRLVAAVVLVISGGGAACARAVPAGARDLQVASADYTVRGEYSPVALDRVDALAVEHGRLVLKGSPADIVVNAPAAADLGRPERHWALVTDAHVSGHRLFVFTDAESVRDVSIELPDSEAPLHFDVFALRDGGEILAFALGDRQAAAPSLWGYVTIRRKRQPNRDRARGDRTDDHDEVE